MKTNRDQYRTLAEVFYFPDDNFRDIVGDAYQMMERDYKEAVADFRPFADWAANTEKVNQQELFTRSFDVQSITTMDIGYVLFGDDYKRGALLVEFNRELRDAGIDTRGELADHLPNVLNLVSKLEDKKLLGDIVVKLLLPAVNKMIAEFNPNQIVRKNKVYKKHQKAILDTDPQYYTVYECALQATRLMLIQDFGSEIYTPPKQSLDFLKSIGSEIDLEPIK